MAARSRAAAWRAAAPSARRRTAAPGRWPVGIVRAEVEEIHREARILGEHALSTASSAIDLRGAAAPRRSRARRARGAGRASTGRDRSRAGSGRAPRAPAACNCSCGRRRRRGRHGTSTAKPRRSPCTPREPRCARRSRRRSDVSAGHATPEQVGRRRLARPFDRRAGRPSAACARVGDRRRLPPAARRENRPRRSPIRRTASTASFHESA